MAQWIEAAEGTSLWDLKEKFQDFELKKGDKMKVVMNLKGPFEWVFDLAGAELVFKPFVPDGMDLVDVYGENGQGIVEMEADPAWLLLVLAFIKAHWVAIAISGFLLTALIASVIVLVKIGKVPELPVAAIAIVGGLAVVGILAYSMTKGGKSYVET